ncbi:NAD-dependent malic enzyme [Thioalkalivibrio paradoxus]|uniref:NAD-dependent malic enzyme, mitochondrial n=1 Tax=Thioalkalivibrio paradoxus ARh 1 TaxID=713585 RepID=W0DJQ6_9GAMM|nr:NAD-dependent malic enzyme [Thioalkalivibrio paradoxus]AHE97482.1 NAD-dependent malic enzyme, mitochondrial [Thioalkalivibrio paradoxus ARh 1]
MPQQTTGGVLPGPLPEWFPRGLALLRDPALNKGSAFSEREREVLGLRGLLPPHVSTQEQQVDRVLENFRRLDSPLERYIMLESLHDRNEALYFRVIMEHPDETMPVIYTPTVGVACQQYGHIFRSPRGLYVSAQDRGRVAEVMRNWPYRDVRIIVITDGERILGLGDLGASGMGIPTGKLALYTACAGVHPRRCLPVMLDVGTNNASLLEDPLYLGLRQRRLTGAAYNDLMAEFIAAGQEVFPGVVIQFEDFASHNAFRLLRAYRERICCFNDDIQGTAAVTLAGVLSALRVTARPLSEQTFLFLGAGEAATGIADLLVSAMVADGLDEAAARGRCWMFDSKGLVVRERGNLAEHKRPYAHAHAPVSDFAAAVEALRPTAIIGVGAVAQAFTREVITAMARINERPIVFALSNPTSKAECTAEQAYAWSEGRALFASGSPFDPVVLDGQRFVPRQGNNSYIFPGLGLGLIAVQALRATDAMFMAAARALADSVQPADLEQGSLFPALSRVRDVSVGIAAEVARVAFAEGLAGIDRPQDLTAFVREQMYEPRYVSYVD